MGDPPVDLSVQLGPLSLRNPVVAASGTVGYGEEMREVLDWSRVGGIIGKTITLEPRKGNEPPRTAETPSGLLNSIGLQNEGLEPFLAKTLPAMRTLGTAVIVNIGGFDIGEFRTLVDALDREEGIAALELNISCPNVAHGGIEFSRDPQLAAQVTARVRAATSLPLWVKLSPEAGDLPALARACEAAGADALTAIA